MRVNEDQKEKNDCLNVRYAALHSSYYMVFCSVFGYISVFLLSRNFSAGSIGGLMAWANIMAAVLQPWVASVADSEKRFTLKGLMLLMGLFSLIPAGLLLITPEVPSVTAALFLIMMAALSIMQPLINAVYGYYMRRGRSVNFGVARGIGSLSYAVLAWFLGILVARLGTDVIPVSMVLFLLLMLVVLSTFRMKKPVAASSPNEGKAEGQEEGRGEERRGKEEKGKVEKRRKGSEERKGEERAEKTDIRCSLPSETGFIRKYKMFFLLMAGIVLIFSFHNMVNTYLIQIMEEFGGNSSDMGASAALAAVCEIPVMLSFSKVIKRFRANQLIRIAGAGFFLKALAVWMAHSVAMVHMSQLLQACSYAILIPASVYYAEQVMEEKDRVKGQAFITAAITAGGVVGNLIGGKIIDDAGVPVLLTAAAAFAAGGMILIWIAAVPAGGRKLLGNRA